MSDRGNKKPGEDPPDKGKKRGPSDCLESDDDSDEDVFTPFTQENPVIVWPDATSVTKRPVKKAKKKNDDCSKPVAKKSVAKEVGSKNALAKNRGSTPSKGKCLGNDLFFLCFEYFDLFFCFSVMVGYIDVDFF